MSNKPKKYVIGRMYHCTWSFSSAFVWVLKSFDESKNVAVMETPKSKKPITTQLDSLRNINRYRDE